MIDPHLLASIKLILDKPLSALTVREALKFGMFMGEDPSDEELLSIGLPTTLRDHK